MKIIDLERLCLALMQKYYQRYFLEFLCSIAPNVKLNDESSYQKKKKGFDFFPQTQIFESLYLFIMEIFYISNFYNSIHSLKYLRYMTSGFKDIGIRISEFVAHTHCI